MKIIEIRENFVVGKEITTKGRIIAERNHKNFVFFDLQDNKGTIQVIIDVKHDIDINIGDIVEVRGIERYSKTREKSIFLKKINIISRCSEHIPFKNKLHQKAKRFFLRHKDLIVNPELFTFFLKRSEFLFAIRKKLFENKYLEFDTGILQSRFDAGFAEPFETEMKDNHKKYFLRLTSEIRLKQLITAGFPKVFEMSKSFRNEGIDRMHNPEFCLLELYGAYQNYNEIMELIERVIFRSIKEVFEKEIFKIDNRTINFRRPWQRISMKKIAKEKLGEEFSLNIKKEKLLRLLRKTKSSFSQDLSLGQIFWGVIEKIIAPSIIQPTFLIDIPSVISPLAKKSTNTPGASERAIFLANGFPIADFYTDENRIQILKPKLKQQTQETGKTINSAFLDALNCGMPPTAGCGIGIDRLLLCLRPPSTSQDIKEVILFPNV